MCKLSKLNQAAAAANASVKSPAKPRAGTEPWRVVVVGDTCVSEQGMVTIVGRDKRYHVCGGAHGFYDAGELIRRHRLDEKWISAGPVTCG